MQRLSREKGIDQSSHRFSAETMPFWLRAESLAAGQRIAQNACPERDYIPAIPERTCLILTESDVDKRGRVYKAVKKYGRSVEFKRQDQRPLVRGCWER